MSYDDEMKQIMKYAIPYTLRGVIEDILHLLQIGVISNIYAKDNSAILGGYFAVDMSKFFYSFLSSRLMVVLPTDCFDIWNTSFLHLKESLSQSLWTSL